MVRGKWRPEAPAILELPMGKWPPPGKTQDALARHHFRQVDEFQQTVINKTDDPGWFDIDELELVLGLMAHDKTPGHDEYRLEMVKKVIRYHPQ